MSERQEAERRRNVLALMAALHVIEKRYPCDVIFCPRQNDGWGFPEFIDYKEVETRLRQLIETLGGQAHG